MAEGADPEYDIGFQFWFSRQEIADDLMAHDLFVDRVGFDVFAIEVDARLGCAELFEALRQSS